MPANPETGRFCLSCRIKQSDPEDPNLNEYYHSYAEVLERAERVEAAGRFESAVISERSAGPDDWSELETLVFRVKL